MSTDTNTPEWVGASVTDNRTIARLRDAGASDDFIRVLQTDTPEGVDRHSVRQEVRKQLHGWNRDPSDMTDLAGHFFTALWNGDKDEYLGRADRNNQRILGHAGLR